MSEAELRRELLDAFEAEYREHLQAIRTTLEREAVAGAALRDVFRRAHSLKGAARAVDLRQVEEIAHGLETLLHQAVERGGPLAADDATTVARGLDAIEARMREAEGPGAGDAAGAAAEPDPEPPPVPPAAEATLRVSAAEFAALAEIVHGLSDAALGRRRDGEDAAEAAEVRALLALWESPELEHAAADPACVEFERRLRQLSRRLSLRRRGRGELDERLDQSVAALQAQLERIALVEAGSVLGPLAGMARELAREQGGELVIRLRGMDLLAERQVLQGLRDPAIQLLRNAVSHGLQPGRTTPLQVELSLALQVGRLELRVEDDGPGPDLGRIERVARERGLLPGGSDAEPDEATLLAVAFEPGFSTAAGIDRLSGRGMGLSIVAEAARRLHGTATLRRGAAGGSVVLVSVPLAARRQTLLLVEAGDALFGLPDDAVERLLLVDATQVVRPDGRPLLRVVEAGTEAGGLAPVAWLAALLGRSGEGVGAAHSRLSGALLAVRGRRCLVVVERLRDVRTLLVRAPDLVGIDRRLVAGLATDGEGRTVLVLEPHALLAALLDAPPPAVAAIPLAAAARPAAPATILVVDDSITTRTLEKTILQAQGYRVMVAVDGLAALDALRTAQWEIDVVVADVEMPRLDGFGLLAAMRDDPRLAGVPTILMTSRNQQADIRRGLELGARAYIAKQDFDQGTLLSTIAQLLP